MKYLGFKFKIARCDNIETATVTKYNDELYNIKLDNSNANQIVDEKELEEEIAYHTNRVESFEARVKEETAKAENIAKEKELFDATLLGRFINTLTPLQGGKALKTLGRSFISPLLFNKWLGKADFWLKR